MGVKPIDYENMSDEGLMDLVIDQDHKAFCLLVRRHTKMFYAAAYRSCGNQDAAEDIVQEAFLKLWSRPEIWDPSRGAKFTTWFYRVVSNKAIDYTRKVKKTKGTEAFERISDDMDNALDVLQREEQEALVEAAIQALPARQKEALNLCFYEGRSNKEAAQMLQVSVKGLESLLMRAKAGVRNSLVRHGVLSDAEMRKEAGNAR